MANYSAFHNFRLDFLHPESMAFGEVVGLPSVTSTLITAQATPGQISITGRGFVVDFQSETASGTVTGLTYSEGGRVLVDVSGLSMELETIIRVLTSEGDDIPVSIEELLVAGDDTMTGSGANDILYGGAGNDTINGGGGFDVGLYRVAHTGFEFERSPDGAVRISRGSEADTYVNVERIQFSDGTLALDTDGVAGQAYRIYQAAFDRTPDNSGLKFWISQMDGGMDLQEVSRRFVDSAEFKQLYSTASANDYVNSLYRNILDREGEAEGVNFWTEQLNSGSRDMAKVLADFAESVENVTGVAPIISEGIWFS